MSRKTFTSLLAVLAISVSAAACSSDNKSGSDTTKAAAETTVAPETTLASETTMPTETTEGLLPDNGQCDDSLKKVVISIETTFESPVLTLGHQVKAAQAAVDAFNKRGGVGGHCLELMKCDDKGDANTAQDCARQIVASEAVASVNDTTTFGDTDVAGIFTAANYPRIGQSPGTPDLNAPNSFNLGGGGLGTTFMMIPPLLDAGFKKIAAIHVDAAAFQGALPLIQKIVEAGGAQFVAEIPVPAGTTDYSQFVLAAQDAGADAVMMPLGDKESLQVLNAAKQLGSTLTYSMSWGTLSQKNVQDFGDFGKQLVFNAEVPPATLADQFPAMKQIVADLSASGEEELQPENLVSSSIRSWMAVYAFVTVMSGTDVDNITRESVMAAFTAATDIPMLDVMPPWTPNKPSTGVFTRLSNPEYYFGTWDGSNFVTTDTPSGNLLDVLKTAGLAG